MSKRLKRPIHDYDPAWVEYNAANPHLLRSVGAAADGGDGGSIAGGDGGDGATGPEAIPFDIGTMPEELTGDASLQQIKTVQDLAKGYVNAQKLVGADKIALPGANADDEAWGAFHSKLGRPDDVAGYEFTPAKEDAHFKPDEGLVKGFSEVAHKFGLSQKQAAGLYDWYSGSGEEQMSTIEGAMSEKREVAEKALRTEFGTAFEEKVKLSQAAVRELGGEELQAFMNETRLGDSVPLIKAFAKMGAMMVEDRLEGAGGVRFGTGKAEALAELETLKGNAEHVKAYITADHPGHKAAFDKQTKLMELAYGLEPVLVQASASVAQG